MKVVISSHPSYHRALQIMLDSLDYKQHLEDIVVCVSDVREDNAADVAESYRVKYSLKHVLTCEQNIDEYTAYVSLGRALSKGEFPEDQHFIMVHDTCEAGRLFWQKLRQVRDSIEPVRFHYDAAAGMYNASRTIAHPIRLADQSPGVLSLSQFAMVDKRLMSICNYRDAGQDLRFVGFVTPSAQITTEVGKACVFEDAELVNARMENAFLWFPVSSNFNIGIAKREFITEHVYPAFDGAVLTKAESIDVEVNVKNPRNLKCLAGARWRYAYCTDVPQVCRYPTMSVWANDTEVYGDGKPRNIAYMHTLDLKKYSVLVGRLWQPSHPSRA